MAWLRDLDTTWTPAVDSVVPKDWFDDVADNFLALGGGATNSLGASTDAFILAGSGSNIDGTSLRSVIVGGSGGDLNTSDDAAIMSSVNATITSADGSVIVGGSESQITGDGTAAEAGVFAGYGWQIDGSTTNVADRSVIVGGTGDNIADGILATNNAGIFAGSLHSISSTVGGESDESVILGGESHSISDSSHASVVGGHNITISGSNHAAVLGGGGATISTASANSVVLGGGAANAITSAQGAGLIGGNTNTVSANHGVIAGGQVNDISGVDSFVGGGRDWVVSGTRSAAIGGDGTGITADQDDTVYLAKLRATSLPTSEAGLAAGTIWNDGGRAAVAGSSGWDDLTDTNSLITATNIEGAFEEIFRGQYAVNTLNVATTYTVPAQPYHRLTMTADTTFSFTSPATDACTMMIRVAGAFSPTWPASVDWHDGTPQAYDEPTLYTFTTTDGGTNWDGVVQAGGLA